MILLKAFFKKRLKITKNVSFEFSCQRNTCKLVVDFWLENSNNSYLLQKEIHATLQSKAFKLEPIDVVFVTFTIL